MTPSELTLVEKPILDILQWQYGYRYIPPDQHASLRARENEVLLKPVLIETLMRLNGLVHDTAEAIYNDLAGITDNQKWLEVLRGHYSRKLPGEETHRTIRLIDFDALTRNDFAVTHQLRVQGEVVRKPDVVVYVNGIPLVVIEAKSPLNPGQNAFDAIHQIHSSEREVPRLFFSNLFNIVTNDMTLLYGATGAPSEHWARWRDPWPRKAEDFTDETEKGLYALLEPSRLLDILAHFIVFETRDGKTIKKVCRYQQFRAVNRMVERVISGKHRAGLIWHTQGSGKSLTMVFAALKLKFHRGILSPMLLNPNLLVITDRIDLHNQIASTFDACGLPNPISVQHIRRPLDKSGKRWKPAKNQRDKVYLEEAIVANVVGKTLLSTIFKFAVDVPGLKHPHKAAREAALKTMAVHGSEQWIVMVDEAHRTQEKDLGAYLRALLPNATLFGFTGTPVKKGDKNTFANFGAQGERYLDKYGIDDAVADGATVPIYYQARLTEWHLHDKEVDALFDQWFVGESPERLEELKARGVTRGDLARFGPRIDLIAVDIWAHFRAHVQPDGFKAQICAVDRLACVAYKKALDRVIAQSLVKSQGLTEEAAKTLATAMSVCVYSPGQHDSEKEPELVTYQIAPEDVTPRIVPRFLDPNDPLQLLIVCNKLLTGFDAPIEQALYLDNPLTDHNLLQAIARTNRRYGQKKDHGLIVDYIGVSKKLSEALKAYRTEDVASAMRDLDVLHDALKTAYKEVMALMPATPRTRDVKADVKKVIAHLGTEDRWYLFRAKADVFLKAYGTLSPDPRVLPFQADLKFIAAVLPYGRLHFEKVEETDWRAYSEKIRQMLDEHLEVTGLKTVCKLRSLSDPNFWLDFSNAEDIQTAAVRKLGELKKETVERTAKNPARYERFSDRIKALIAQFSQGLIDAARILDETEKVAREVLAEDEAHKGSGLNERAYGVAAILKKFKAEAAVSEASAVAGAGDESAHLPKLQEAAAEIDALYASDTTAPILWQTKTELKKDLRGQVRRIIQHLGLSGWQKEVPLDVEQYAVLYYGKG